VGLVAASKDVAETVVTAEPGRFVRNSVKPDAEFFMGRNWWVRDRRIFGNPLSLYLFLHSHDVGYVITLERARKAVGLGVEAFATARRRLEEAGFLERQAVRYPPSAVDADGNNIAGRIQRYDIHILDPEQPPERAAKGQPVGPGSGSAVSVESPDEAHVARPVAPVDNSTSDTPVDNSATRKTAESAQNPWSDQLTGFPLAANPLAANPLTGFPLLKEENQVKENQSSSSDDAGNPPGDNSPPGAAAPPPDDDDGISSAGDDSEAFQRLLDAGIEASLRDVHARLSLSAIRRRLGDAGLDHARVDIPAAASQALAASSRPVGDPSAYVAIAIIREPGRWPWGPLPQGESPRGGVRSTCEALGCKYLDQWRMLCVRCGQERDGWRDERDAQLDAPSMAVGS